MESSIAACIQSQQTGLTTVPKISRVVWLTAHCSLYLSKNLLHIRPLSIVNFTNIYQELVMCQAVRQVPSIPWKQPWRMKALEGWVWAPHPVSDLENEPPAVKTLGKKPVALLAQGSAVVFL